MHKQQNSENRIIRAFSVLKEVSSDAREITGIATTPSPDRAADIVEPDGVQVDKDIPLLWQHYHDSPVGRAFFDKPTKDGFTFRAKIAEILEEGDMKRLTDKAWHAVKAGLVRGVSIGFIPLESSYIQETGGSRFIKSEIYELSLVTIPMNADATIQTVKSFYHRNDPRNVIKLITPKSPVVKSVKLSTGAVRLIDRNRY